jgi:hypothetical protein
MLMANSEAWLPEPAETNQTQAGTAIAITRSPAASGTCPDDFATAVAGPYTISLTDVLGTLVEGYLLGDLKSMATEIKPKEIGAVGYPMTMAVLTGSELLATLASDVAKANRIEHYWTTYMTKVDRKYGTLARSRPSCSEMG